MKRNEGLLWNYLLLSAMLVLSSQASSQIVHYGVKTGVNLSWIKHDGASYKNLYRILPTPGFNAGAVASFKVKDRYFLHAEILYSTKGKRVKGKVDKDLDERVTYNFIDVPLMYNMYFDAQLKMKNIKRFKWYAGIGPNFSYWLGGKGRIYNTEFAENDFPALNYKLIFGKRSEDFAIPKDVYISDAKRLQLGLCIGGGILLEPISGQKVMIDLRFDLGHTWMGSATSADYVIPLDYEPAKDLRDRNMGLRLSFMYMLESSLDKKSLNKGKSTIKKKQR